MTKLAKLLLVATVSTIFATAAPLVPEELKEPTSSHPGALFASLKMSSINNIFQLMAPLLADEILTGKTIAGDIHKSVAGIGINIDQMNVTKVSDAFDHTLAWKKDANDTMSFTFSNFDVNGTFEGNVTGLPGQKCTLKGFNFVNITLAFELATPETAAHDGIHWQLMGKPTLAIGDIQIKVKQFSWQVALNKVLPIVVSGINYGLKLAEGVIEGLAWGLNKKLESGPMNMLVNLGSGFNGDLNLTTTRAPSLSQETDLIQVWLDGRFVDGTTGQSTEPVNTVEPVRNTEKLQYDQIFVHESMVQSALFKLYTMDKMITPDEALRNQLMQIFYEVGAYYGNDVQFELELTFDKSEGEAVKFSNKDGIEIGNIPANGLNVTVGFLCSNATMTTPEKAVELQLDVRANVNASFDNFVIYASANDVLISNTIVTEDKVGLDYHAFDQLLTSVAKTMSDNFNLSHSAGMNLVDKFPTLGFIAGMARNSILTPFEQDEFIYAGFKWISDWGEARTVAQEFLQL